MNNATAQGDKLTQFILEIFRINGELLTAGNKITKPFGLTSARWQVMGTIDLAGQPLTVAQIARRMGLTRQAVQRVVNDLKKLDMVELLDNQDHKRSPLVSITTQGSNILTKVDQAQNTWVNKLAEGESAETIQQSLGLLKKIRERLEQDNH